MAGLAFGCGGIARYESPVGSDASGGGAVNAATAGADSMGGSRIIEAPAAGAPATGAGGVTDAFYNPSCPYARWNCSELSTGNLCYFDLKSKDDPVASRCTCDTSRPLTGSACKAGEVFMCRQARPPHLAADQHRPPTWDGLLHVQCACVAVPPPTKANCTAACISVFGFTGGMQCRQPDSTTCDDRGVCTEASAEVMKQTGVVCGCSDIDFK
ncbi:MAG TPA: hypothetical protein VER11_23515 [Polyangiaceae bacterium]|nr:hypothetical protein [Polyangiaceae bacterium]